MINCEVFKQFDESGDSRNLEAEGREGAIWPAITAIVRTKEDKESSAESIKMALAESCEHHASSETT